MDEACTDAVTTDEFDGDEMFSSEPTEFDVLVTVGDPKNLEISCGR
jgi:hypothetical protein